MTSVNADTRSNVKKVVRTLADNAPMIVWEADLQGRCIYLNPDAMTGLSSAQEVNISDWLEFIHPEDLPRVSRLVDEARENLREYQLEYRVLRSDGSTRWIMGSAAPRFAEDGTLKGYLGMMVDVSEKRDVTREMRAAKEMARLANMDALTGLPNRALLEVDLTQRLKDRGANAPQAVLFIDLDNFKEVNDSLGHRAGDILLKHIASRLRQCLRPDDMVARLGGDEFVVVAECPGGNASVVALAGKLRKELGMPLVIEGQEVRLGNSIGISLYPQDGDNSEQLLQNADTALYRAKAKGGTGYCFYTPEMGAKVKARLMLQSALRHAVERNEFEVFYQPRIELKTFTMTGMEALLRWNHPQLGLLEPADFIPLAEEIHLIDEIGDWVLRRATSQTREWTVRYNKPLRVSVNLSAHQLRNKGLVASVAHALRASCLPADQLELELTESGLMEDPELAASMLKELKALGLHFSVDDFGTGYSSLAYLCRFPLHTLKLDRSFLALHDSQDVSPRMLAKVIINMAHTLNLSVVAEGVENGEHLGFLSNTSCDEIQGFFMSKPLSAAEFECILQEPRGQGLPAAMRFQTMGGRKLPAAQRS